MPTALRQLNWIVSTAGLLLLFVLGTASVAGPLEGAEHRTTLAELAEGMKPGEWAELKTDGLGMQVFSDGGHHALQYTDEAVWDPVPRQLFFCGEGHGAAPRFVKYDGDRSKVFLYKHAVRDAARPAGDSADHSSERYRFSRSS